MSRWNDRADVARGADYDRRWAELEAAGESVHGEADLVEALLRDRRPDGGTVLDAGCGTGRVAVELDRRGIETVGVDLDPAMLDTARAKPSGVTWRQGDLARLDLGRRFDVVAAAGNVMVFLAPGTEGTVVDRLAAHLVPGGLLVTGWSRTDSLRYHQYDEFCATVGLALVHRWSTWDRQTYDDGDYAVSVHRAGAGD